MVEPFVLLWFGILVGICFSAWPFSLALCLAAGFLFWLGRSRKVLVFSALALGLLRGGLSFHFAEPPSQIKFSSPQVFEVRVISESDFGVTAVVESLDLEKPSTSILVRLSGRLPIGLRLRGVGRIQPLQSYESIHRLEKERTRLSEGLVGRLKWIGKPEYLEPRYSLREMLRAKIFAHLKSSYPLVQGMRRALVVGDSSGLPQPLWKAMNYLGLSHALVISGSHLSLLILICGILARRVFRSLRLKSYLSFRMCLLISIGFFYFICNQEASLERALLGFLLISLVGFIFPPIHRYSLCEQLAFVGTLMALADPISVFGASYTLSFGATFALLKSFDWKETPIVFYPYFLVAPICFLFGFIVHPLSPIFNLLILPVFFVIIVPSALLSLIHSSLEPAANFLIEKFFDFLQALFQILESASPVVHLEPVSGLFALLGVLFLFYQRALSAWRRFAFLLILILGFQLFAFLPMKFGSSNDRSVVLKSLDVGQGDSFFLKMEDLKIAIDGGGPFEGARQLLPAVLKETQNLIDLWVFTHFDRDHIGNFREVRGSLRPKQIWIPRFDRGEFSRELPDKNVEVVGGFSNKICSEHFCIHSWVDAKSGHKSQRVKNQDSVVLILSEKGSREMIGVFLGDLLASGERKLIRQLMAEGYYPKNGRLTLLKAAHHGSNSSSSEELLSWLKPEVVVISSGRHNPYRHPNNEVLIRLENAGAKVFRSDIHGHLEFLF